MINNLSVAPVSIKRQPELRATSQPVLSKKEIQHILEQAGHKVKMKEELKGGVVSKVYAASYNKEPAVVKATFATQPNDPTVFETTTDIHFADNRLLDYLASCKNIRVPHILMSFQDMPITIMEDLRSSGFLLYSDELLAGKLHMESATRVGKDIATIQKNLSRHVQFCTPLSALQNFYARGLELRLAYPNSQDWYKAIEKRFSTAHTQLIAVDTHPKNMFVNPTDESCAWIDFGGSTWADRDFALPNFLAHIAVYAIADYVNKQEAVSYIEQAIASYREILDIKDDIFMTYFASEILHRWAGKWIEGVENQSQKLALLSYGTRIFDDQLFSVSSGMRLLRSL